MTFRLLASVAMKHLPLDVLAENFLPFGHLYDHQLHTAGCLYAGQELEGWVTLQGCDPAYSEDRMPPIETLDRYLHPFLRSTTLIVVEAPENPHVPDPLRTNYTRYEAWARRDQFQTLKRTFDGFF